MKETAITTQEPIMININNNDPIHALTGNLSNLHSKNIPKGTKLSTKHYNNIIDKYFKETVCSLAVAVAKSMTLKKSKATTKKGYNSIKKKLFTESGGKNCNNAVVTLSTSWNTRSEKKRKQNK